MTSSSNELQEVLTSLYKRASEAEDRLARLEAAFASKQDSGYEDLLKKFNDLQLKLEDARTLQDSEREKALNEALKEVQQRASENAKLQYRIIHLVRALEEADSKITSN